MVGAIITHLFIVGGSPAMPIVLLAVDDDDRVGAKGRPMSARTATAVVDPTRLDEGSLRRLFLEARTHNRWLDLPVDDALLRELYELDEARADLRQQPADARGVREEPRREGAAEAGARAAERREDHDARR